MIETQKIIDISRDDLRGRVLQYHENRYRLVQISCVRLDLYEIQYSFDKDHSFESLKIRIPFDDNRVPSVSDIYLAAFLYENEIHDLYGVNIEGIVIDYKGNFYKTSAKHPFNTDAPKTGAK